jgi:hypothetical protein
MPMTASRGRRSGRAAGRMLILATLIGTTVVTVAGCAADRGSTAENFVSKLIARDASAGLALVSPDSLAGIASQAGLAGWPGSVTFVESNMVVAKGANDAAPTVMSFRLDAKMGDHVVASSEVEMALPFVKIDGGDRIDGGSVSVAGALPAPDPELLSKAGTSSADAQSMLDDFRSGAAWLGGSVTASLRSSTEPIHLDVVADTDPNRLTSYHEETAQAIDGETTTWFVTVAGPGTTVASYKAASAITKVATPARTVDGTIDPRTLQNDAHTVSVAFRDALARGDTPAAEALMLNPTAIAVTPAGWARMKDSHWIATAVESPDLVKIDGDIAPFSATDGEIVLKQTADGAWKVDALATKMIVDVRPGSGSYRYRNNSPLIGYGGDVVEVKLSKVTVGHWAQGYYALAEFGLHSLDKCESWGCDMYATDSFVAATAAWKGNAAGTAVLSTSMSGATALGANNLGSIRVDGVGPDNLPLTITVTAFGNQNIGKGWVFKSK